MAIFSKTDEGFNIQICLLKVCKSILSLWVSNKLNCSTWTKKKTSVKTHGSLKKKKNQTLLCNNDIQIWKVKGESKGGKINKWSQRWE